MNWKYTTVHHPVRVAMGLSLNEYAILDIFYQSQTHPDYTFDGWAKNSYADVASFFSLTKGCIHKIVSDAVDMGLMEVNPANPHLKRTTENWYRVAYLKELPEEQIPNYKERSKNERKENVQKMNAERSKNERNRSNSERHLKEEKKEKKLKRSMSPDSDTKIPDFILKDLETLDKRLNGANAHHRQTVIDIVDAFNEITGRKVRYSTQGALKLILHWLKEGHGLPEFKAVFSFKYQAFKNTENEKYIALDTFCRIDKFEDTLEKTRQNQTSHPTELVFDCELNGSTDYYKKYWERTKEAFPNVAQEIRFFTASEFKKFIAETPEWFPMIHQCISNELYKKHIKTALAQLESDSNRKRTAQGGLYSYLTSFLTQKAKE